MSRGFLTAEEIKERSSDFFPRDELPEKRFQGASCDLSLGEEVYITGHSHPVLLSEAEPFVTIPRGQFALLMTKEYVVMPRQYLALISIKFSVKKTGLINISGFHVDPGRDGKIIFSVFNAGPSDVILRYGDAVFMIFFYELEKMAEPYKGKLKETVVLPTDLVTSLKGTSASLSDVDKRVRDVEITTRIFIGLFAALAAGMVALFVRVL